MLQANDPTYWRTKDGRWVRIVGMTTDHLRNTIAFLRQRGIESAIAVAAGSQDPVALAESAMCPFPLVVRERFRRMLVEYENRRPDVGLVRWEFDKRKCASG